MSKRTFLTARLKLFSLLGIVLLLSAFSFAPQNAQAVGSAQAALLPTPTYSKIFMPVVGRLAAGGMPVVSTSLYVDTIDPQALVDQGCAVGTRDLNLPGVQDTVVVLDFGVTAYFNNSYGASLMGNGPVTLNEIAAAVENFGFGYWKCVGSDFESHVRLAIGTNNYVKKIYSYEPAVTYAHGKAWAEMVNAVNTWFRTSCNNGCDGQVDAVGANDIELSWGSHAATTDWLNGYSSAALYPLYNFGAIEGCPYTYIDITKTSTVCGGYSTFLWSRDQVLSVTWRIGAIYPIPEIYANSGVNAKQWYYLSLYSYERTGSKMQFLGPMTEYGACQQYPSGCTGINSSPEQSWRYLHQLLNSDPRTAGEYLPYPTDIRYLE